jgi:hypothetical protein
METALTRIALAESDHAGMMNLIFFAVTACAVYKLAWIIRQVSDLRARRRWPTVVTSAALAVVLLYRSYAKIFSNQPADYFDISLGLSLCAFLITAIILIRGKAKRY